jgi:hypothetical protein
MALKSPDQSVLLGFLKLFETSGKDGYLGAILITNDRGVPQEFRCTHPVKPTVIQKPLYGDTLVPHIAVHLCGMPLVKATQNRPSLLIVGNEYLLGVKSATACPVVFIRRAGEAIEIKGANGQSTAGRERIDSTSGRFQPIIIEGYPETDDARSGREILEKVFAYLDPLEPFERMGKAIEVLAKQDSKYQ